MENSEHFEPVGITLVTGFLGSGKSTFIRRVLTEHHGLRIVVVENEFGSTATIEQAIVTSGVGSSVLEEFIELPNGCICCQAQDDLVDSLTRLVDRKKGRFDHILVEASGLADPRPVAASLWVDAVADAALRLDSVIAVVDGSRIESGKEDNNELARMQVAVADVVLLNKMDLVKEKPEKIGSMLRKIGCTGEIMPTVKCQVDIALLLKLRRYDSDAAITTLMEGRSSHNIAPSKFMHHIHEENDDHEGDDHADKNKNKTDTFTLMFDGARFDETLLNRALGHLLWDEPENEDTESRYANSPPAKEEHRIWRMKSLVVMDDDDETHKWIFQSVHTLFDDMVSSVRADDGVSQFLFIGQGMDKDKIRQMLSSAIASSSKPLL